ncbi:hypothetical protein BDV28DRAFT_137122 [Aspergillus coremiiformis]|uniref:Pal1 cell morphology protein-domain-containing protein n=1 Tax=Aspergillus coremiiformis TaxID=138285 RepID=A0A5N6Z186_9EURO|nr:hypothetical protein BDV28DRAFT_137122 [Aspergillus coremiiformis]
MTSTGEAIYMTPYSPYPSHHQQWETELNMNNAYCRFLSPSPTRQSLRHQRSSSIPSVYFDGYLEHIPVEPKRRRESPSRYNHHTCRHSRGARRTMRYSRNSQLVNPDVIDRLDSASFYQYHHEGPYDAVYPERNLDSKVSPVEAVKGTNEEALKATPEDKIKDSLNAHRPLDGVAFYPPGATDWEGRTYHYEEGTNMMNDYGNFIRCPGIKFTEEDFKNDPFYNSPLPKPFASLRKALNLRRRNRKGAQ